MESRGSVWRPVNLAMLSPSITTLAGFVCEGDKQARHSFSRFLSSPCNKRKNYRNNLNQAQMILSLYEALNGSRGVLKMPWLVAAREGERVPGMCWGFRARCWEGVQWVACWFCPYELCDLGKVNSFRCASDLLTWKMRVTIPTHKSGCGIRLRNGRKGLSPVSNTP